MNCLRYWNDALNGYLLRAEMRNRKDIENMAVYHIFFSPTGGTKTVSDILVQSLVTKLQLPMAIEVDLLQRTNLSLPLQEEDLCIVAVPAYGGRVPQAAAEKLRALQGDGAGAVLVSVFGNRAIDDTLIELQDILQDNGFRCLAAVEAVAEHSLARKYGAGRPDAEDRQELEDFAERIASLLKARSKRIAEREKEQGLHSLQVPGNRPYKEFQPSPMAPVVAESCINCKRCVKECPVGAIASENVGQVDPSKCFSCMHCVAVCPMKARSNDPSRMQALEERLRDRCSGRKINQLYLP